MATTSKSRDKAYGALSIYLAPAADHIPNVAEQFAREEPTLDLLRAVHGLMEAADIARTHLVAAARAEGASWAAIGDETNMSRQAAHERWRHVDL